MTNSLSRINQVLTREYIQSHKEDQYFDRKSARKDIRGIAHHFVAFANANGGTLVVGVEDNGDISGFEITGAHNINAYKTMPYDLCKTTPEFIAEEIELVNDNGELDKILVFHIKPSSKRVIKTTSDNVYLRTGDESKKLTHDQITSLEYDKGERTFEEELVERSSIDDIDGELLDKYKKIINTPLSSSDVLEARGLLFNGKLTLAGVLLFSKNPSKFLPNARLRFLRYEGTKAETGERINLIKDINIDGSIPNIIQVAKNTINSQLREFQILGDEGKFKSLPEYPEFAWFEGIVNALTHRDYSIHGEHIKVIMYDDRLEILSPGHLPNIVNLNNMKHTRYSRNPNIARTLYEFGWVKELNEGVKRIYEEMSNFYLEEPIYSEPNGNSVLLKLENNYVMRSIRNGEFIGNLLTNVKWQMLTSEERKIITATFREGKITVKYARQITNRGTIYCRNLLKKLKDEKILSWYGSSENDPKQYYSLFIQE